MRTRVIPCLLLRAGGLCKTTMFRNPKYVGDPINAVKIFNTKEVDELVILDIEASEKGPDFALVGDIVSEAFMPIAYGGGIAHEDQAAQLFEKGIEKIIVNSALRNDPALIDRLALRFGSQAVVVAMDVRRSLLGRLKLMTANGSVVLANDPARWAQEMENRGAGEILLTSIDREGTGKGFDLALVQTVSAAVSIPVVAHGGTGRLEDFKAAIDAGASAVAAGRFFVYQGRHDAVLISYPKRSQLESLLP